MKKLIQLLFLLLPLIGVGQNWQQVNPSSVPITFSGDVILLDTINPIDDTLLFSTYTGGVWQYGHSYKTVFDSISHFQGWVTDTLNTYHVSDTGWFEVKAELGQGNTSWIYFEHKFQTDSLSDFGYVSYSCNGMDWRVLNGMYEPDPNNWFPHDIRYHNYLDIPSETPPLVDDTLAVFSGSCEDWNWTGVNIIRTLFMKRENENLSSDGCFESSDSIRFRFNFNTDSIVDNLSGWMIRNIIVGQSLYSQGVDPKTNYQPLSIYPNPTTSTIRIQLPENNLKATRTSLYDISGRLVLQQPFEPNMNISFLANGTYVILVETRSEYLRSFITKY